MMKDKALNKLLRNRSHLLERYSSEQYELSKEILRWKHKHGHSNIQMAELLQISLQTYLKYEGGYTDFTVEAYENVLLQLQLHDYQNRLMQHHRNQPEYSSQIKVKVLQSLSDHSGNFSFMKHSKSDEKARSIQLPKETAFQFGEENITVASNYPYQLFEANQKVTQETEAHKFVYQ